MSTDTSTAQTFTLEERQNFSPVGLRALFRVEDTFRLSDVEIGRILGGASRSDVKEWKRAALAKETVILPSDTLQRLVKALVIFNELGRKFHKSLDKAEEWLRRPNGSPVFGTRSPIALMMDVEPRYIMGVAKYAQSHPLVLDFKIPAQKPERKRNRS